MPDANRWGNERTLACDRCGKLRYPGGKRVTNLCRECKAQEPRERVLVHGLLTSYDKGKCRCGECTRAKREAQREYVSRRKAAGNPVDWSAYKSRTPSLCPTCGSGFLARTDQRYCSRTCNPRSQRKDTPLARRRRMTKEGRAFRTRAETVAEQAARGTTGKGTVWVQGACRFCGDEFMSRGVSSRYCSKECRAVVRGLQSDWIDWELRLQIYERDGWHCGLCDRVTLLGVKDDSRPTLDHIIPRSRGGSHDRSNLRLLCSRCNSKRGDLTYFSDEEVRRAFSS